MLRISVNESNGGCLSYPREVLLGTDQGELGSNGRMDTAFNQKLCDDIGDMLCRWIDRLWGFADRLNVRLCGLHKFFLSDCTTDSAVEALVDKPVEFNGDSHGLLMGFLATF
jgi:hypothetical protein